MRSPRPRAEKDVSIFGTSGSGFGAAGAWARGAWAGACVAAGLTWLGERGASGCERFFSVRPWPPPWLWLSRPPDRPDFATAAGLEPVGLAFALNGAVSLERILRSMNEGRAYRGPPPALQPRKTRPCGWVFRYFTAFAHGRGGPRSREGGFGAGRTGVRPAVVLKRQGKLTSAPRRSCRGSGATGFHRP